MAFDVSATLKALQTHLSKSGYFVDVIIGEPKAPPPERFVAGLMMAPQGRRVAYLTLAGTVELHTILIRIYTNAEQDPIEDLELGLARVVDKVWGDLCGDFDLGGTIRNVDVGGEFGDGLHCEWAWLEKVSGTTERIADITVPMIVNDVVMLVA